MDPDFTATGFCPLCCSNVDIEGTGEQTLTCNNCGTEWTMVINPETFATFSIH